LRWFHSPAVVSTGIDGQSLYPGLARSFESFEVNFQISSSMDGGRVKGIADIGFEGCATIRREPGKMKSAIWGLNFYGDRRFF